MDDKEYNARLTDLTDRAIEAVEKRDMSLVDPIRHDIVMLGAESGRDEVTEVHFQRMMAKRGYEDAF